MRTRDLFLLETGERILSSLREQWAEDKAREDAKLSRSAYLAAAREYRRIWGTTPCVCSGCSSSSLCATAWVQPDCGQF